MPEYTVQRCRSLSDDGRIGPTHGSEDGEYTICGIEIDQYWWIDGSGTVTCKKCLSQQNAHKPTMNIVFSGPIEGICTRPGLWLESGAMAQPLVYFQKPKWVKNDAAWEKFLRDVFANVRLEARDLDVLRSEVTE